MTTDILLAVAGMTPQVITETLYAILKEEPERFPKEIYVITTTEGDEKIRNNLLGANGKLNEFCNEYGLDSFKIDQDRHLKIIRDADNNLIEDARTREDQNIIADFIFNEVKELTALNDVADGRSFDQTHPFVEREDGNFLNINFLKAQHDLWSNAKGDVNEQIKEKVNRNYIADFYLLRYDQKKKTYMIDIDPENITII